MDLYCEVCSGGISPYSPSSYHIWRVADPPHVGEPPTDCEGATICVRCYHADLHPAIMAHRIRHWRTNGLDVAYIPTIAAVVMPDGLDGHICTQCKNFRPYVAPPDPSTYICYECK